MTALFLRLIAVVFALLPIGATAEPITLKLSFFSSDRSPAYLSLVKPFVDAIEREGEDLLKIKVYFSGALNPPFGREPQFVLEGGADMAFIVPGADPDRFPDNAAIEFPGLFRDSREASLVHTRLIAAKALRGYDDFFVIAAVGTQPETIHSRKPTASLADIKGQKLRVNNGVAATAMAKLGALPMEIPLNRTSTALGAGSVDAALLQTAQLFDIGIGRLTTHHFLFPFGSAPLALVLNRKVFDNLPEQAKSLIRKYSGEWAVTRYVETSDAFGQQVIEQLKADPRRKVTFATTADLATAQQAFEVVTKNWATLSAHKRELLNLVRAELAKLRSSN